MKSLTFLLIGATILSSFTGCIQQNIAPRGDGSCYYQPIHEETADKLQRAITECASVELYREWYGNAQIREAKRTLQRGTELDGILAKLGAVPQWYDQCFHFPPCIIPAESSRITFFDAQGNKLWSIDEAWPGIAYTAEDGTAESIYSFFSFPEEPLYAEGE